MKISIPTLLFIALLAASIPGSAATFTVNHLQDDPDFNPGDGICDVDADATRRCSIRAAIEEAFTDQALDVIEVPPWPDGSPYTLTLTGPFGSFVVFNDITVRGVGTGRVEIIEPNDELIFQTASGSELRLENLTLTCLNDTVTTAVQSFGATVLQDVTIAGCAVGAEAIVGDLEIIRSTLEVNQLGVVNRSSTVLIFDSTLRENVNRASLGVGGGLRSFGSVGLFSALTLISGSLIQDNASAFGGGLGIETLSEVVIVNSTITGNRADEDGAGIYLVGDPDIHIANTTVAFNRADDDGDGVGTGGGLFNADTADVFLRNTILGNNTGTGPFVLGWDCLSTASVFSQGFNLIHRSLGCAGVLGDLTNILEQDPLLADLATNGGRTPNHEPLPASPVIDAGNPAGCTFDDDLDNGVGTPDVAVTIDQRGAPRPFDGDGNGSAICDVGSVEVQPGVLFTDGFESGDFDAWTQIVGGV